MDSHGRCHSTSTTTQAFLGGAADLGTVRAVEATTKRDYILRAVVQVRLISIISPLLNEAEQVERFAADVAAQDYEGGDVEVIVADGGSTDGSVGRLMPPPSGEGWP
jgi:Glycosyl transferase family 2